MKGREPIAFMSYVRSDDAHDYGRISQFRERLEGEVRIQTGRRFDIFQDRNDISWGDRWREILEGAILNSSFLIPIITPSYFHSRMCREEFETFLKREEILGINSLIFPVLYVSCDQLDTSDFDGDSIVKVLKERNWADWRKFRLRDLRDQEVAEGIESFAGQLRAAAKKMDSIAVISKEKEQPKTSTKQAVKKTAVSDKEDTVFTTLPKSKSRSKPPYTVFSTEFDEVIRASDIIDVTEIGSLYKKLSSYTQRCLRVFGKSIKEYANLISEQDVIESWAISILVDNSGSMRGEKISYAAAWSLIAAEALEQLGCEVEVLGYTTRAWKGGQSREKWFMDGKPSNPGRLNDLRHLIYKDFEEDISAARLNFSTMLREGLLKENIDGEALEWAASRLRMLGTNNKLLLVISDGAPVDDSTLAVNGNDILLSHLKKVAGEMEAAGDIILVGMGVGYDASTYFGKSVTVENASMLGEALSQQISSVLNRT